MNLVMIRPSRNNLEGPICELFFPPHKTISFPRYVSTIVVRILGGGITVHHHGILLVIGGGEKTIHIWVLRDFSSKV